MSRSDPVLVANIYLSLTNTTIDGCRSAGAEDTNSTDSTTSQDQSTEEEVVKHMPFHRPNVRNYMTSIPILLCCFCSGLVDSAVFNAGGVFATMQASILLPFLLTVLSLRLSQSSHINSTNARRTGNTIRLAFGASHQPVGHPRAWL